MQLSIYRLVHCSRWLGQIGGCIVEPGKEKAGRSPSVGVAHLTCTGCTREIVGGRQNGGSRGTFALSYNSVVPDGVAINVMTSQSMVLSGEGANVSEMTPKKLERPFLIFSVAPEELSVFSERQTQLTHLSLSHRTSSSASRLVQSEGRQGCPAIHPPDPG